MTNSSNWLERVKLATNWLNWRHAVCVRRHAVCTNPSQLVASPPVGSKLVALALAWQNMGKNWRNWIGNARYGSHRIIGLMTNWQPISPVGRQLDELVELDGALGRPLAGVAPVRRGNIHEIFRGRHRGPWQVRKLGGFIGDADISLLTEQKNTPLQQQHRFTHGL